MKFYTFLNPCRFLLVVMWQAWQRFNRHDSWALASHIALSLLMAFFPFLIAVTALATFFNSASLADDAVALILRTWPEQIAAPLAREVERLLTVKRTDIMTISFFLSLYFASSGVSGLRIGLNRAYERVENRSWWWLRLSSIITIALAAIILLCFAFLLVLGPIFWNMLLRWIPELRPYSMVVGFTRISVAMLLFIVALFIIHIFVPAGLRAPRVVFPGILTTIILWLVGGTGFSWYLQYFSSNYAITYGSLATAMMSLVFLYLFAAIFLFGGEINGTLIERSQQEGPHETEFKSAVS